jgi:hypothetical protein
MGDTDPQSQWIRIRIQESEINADPDPHNTVAFYELCYVVAGESSMVTGSPGQEDDDPRHGPNI